MNRDQSHLDLGALEGLLRPQSIASGLQPVLSDEIRQHLSECEPCRELVRMFEDSGRELESLRLEKPLADSAQCPTEELLRELACGIVESDLAGEVVEHVMLCSHCAPIYRQIAEEMRSDLSADEERLIGNLVTSKPSAQAELGRLMSDSKIEISERKLSSNKLKPPATLQRFVWYSLAASIMICAVLVWIRNRSEEVNPNALLAKVYSEQRPFDFRFEESPYGVPRNERGTRLASSKPQSLTEAELRIKRGLSARPEDPALLAAKGKAELLDSQFGEAVRSDAAINDLKIALDRQPDSPASLSDLAIAYATRGDEEGDPTSYKMAIELLGRALQIDPSSKVAIFNRALAEERLNLFEAAEKDWNLYLQLDDSGDWAAEARRHLIGIQKPKSPVGPSW